MAQRMQAYTPTNESTDLRGSSAKRGLDAMNANYVGPNYLDGGSVASFGDPQLTTRNDYMRQNEGQNLMTNVPGKTVEATNAANLDIVEDSQKKEQAQIHQRAYTANVLEHPNMKSSATRQLADPATQQMVMGDIATSRVQNSMLG